MGHANGPGLALLVAAACLFGALATIAWHQDSAKEIEALKKTDSSHVCDRLRLELLQQAKIRLRSYG